MKRGDHVRNSRFPGVAFWFVEECDEHYDCAITIMVGDDRRWHSDISDLSPLDEDEFCGSCGQIGCGHGT